MIHEWVLAASAGAVTTPTRVRARSAANPTSCKMHRHTLALSAAAIAACFNDPGAASSESGLASTDSSSAEAGTTALTAGDAVTSLAESSTGTSTTAASESTPGSTGEELPAPRAAWRFDGDLTEDVDGADALSVGSISFVSSPTSLAAAPSASSYIDASAVGPLVLAARDAFTMLVRVRLDDLVGNQMLWSLGPAWAEGMPGEPAEHNATAFSVLDGQFHLFTETGAGTNHYVDPAPGPPPGQWTTVVVVVDADLVRVYVDGALAGASQFVPSETSTTFFYMAGLMNTEDPADTSTLHGAIDEARFWDVALEEEQAVAVSTT